MSITAPGSFDRIGSYWNMYPQLEEGLSPYHDLPLTLDDDDDDDLPLPLDDRDLPLPLDDHDLPLPLDHDLTLPLDDDLTLPLDDDQPRRELCLNDTPGQANLDDILGQPDQEEEEQDEILDAGKVPASLAPVQHGSQAPKIPSSHRGNKRKAPQISEATLEQLSKGNVTSQILINAQKEWGLSINALVIASGLTRHKVVNAQIDPSNTDSDILDRIVYVLKNGPGCQLSNRQQELNQRAAKVDRIGFASIVNNICKVQKLSQRKLAKECTKIVDKMPQSTIFKIQKGDSSVDISSLAIVAHVLGLKPEDYNLPAI